MVLQTATCEVEPWIPSLSVWHTDINLVAELACWVSEQLYTAAVSSLSSLCDLYLSGVN